MKTKEYQEKITALERKHVEHLSHIGNRIARLEKHIVALVKLLSEDEAKQHLVATIIAGDDIDLLKKS